MARRKIQLNPKLKATMKDASIKLTGHKKRAFMARATWDYFDGSPRKAESYMGWSREAVAKGMKELETGIICNDNDRAKGRKKAEDKDIKLEENIKYLVDGKSQADPKFKTVFCYARTSARAVREGLKEEFGYREDQLPSRQTIGTILNRMGYLLKKHKK